MFRWHMGMTDAYLSHEIVLFFGLEKVYVLILWWFISIVTWQNLETHRANPLEYLRGSLWINTNGKTQSIFGQYHILSWSPGLNKKEQQADYQYLSFSASWRQTVGRVASLLSCFHCHDGLDLQTEIWAEIKLFLHDASSWVVCCSNKKVINTWALERSWSLYHGLRNRCKKVVS